MGGGGKYTHGDLGREEVQCVAGGNQQSYWAVLGSRYLLGPGFISQ